MAKKYKISKEQLVDFIYFTIIPLNKLDIERVDDFLKTIPKAIEKNKQKIIKAGDVYNLMDEKQSHNRLNKLTTHVECRASWCKYNTEYVCQRDRIDINATSCFSYEVDKKKKEEYFNNAR